MGTTHGYVDIIKENNPIGAIFYAYRDLYRYATKEYHIPVRCIDLLLGAYSFHSTGIEYTLNSLAKFTSYNLIQARFYYNIIEEQGYVHGFSLTPKGINACNDFASRLKEMILVGNRNWEYEYQRQQTLSYQKRKRDKKRELKGKKPKELGFE